MKSTRRFLPISVEADGRSNVLNGLYDGCGAAQLMNEIIKACCSIDKEQMEKGAFAARMRRLERRSMGFRRRRICLLGCMLDPRDLKAAPFEARCLICCQIFFEHYMFLKQNWMARHLVRAVWEVAVELNEAAAAERNNRLARWLMRGASGD